MGMYYQYDMEYVKKTITITEEQDRWINEKSINLSRLVQKCLAKEMERK